MKHNKLIIEFLKFSSQLFFIANVICKTHGIMLKDASVSEICIDKFAKNIYI